MVPTLASERIGVAAIRGQSCDRSPLSPLWPVAKSRASIPTIAAALRNIVESAKALLSIAGDYRQRVSLLQAAPSRAFSTSPSSRECWFLGLCGPSGIGLRAAALSSIPVVRRFESATVGYTDAHTYPRTVAAVWSGKGAHCCQSSLGAAIAGTQRDDFICRLLWALADRSGLRAKRIADFTPAPSLG
ncbi:hypothetical protein AWB70_02207 [Caballeronia cordobensis]|uniref:Uncharacterized protein n=1 Tax=Caballeronia cordobensis TaxID=1353886 RepID=A0A158GND3_CABCO|nr:hypothetical protein AWB70_02207 [Caballeronia cordobensis]